MAYAARRYGGVWPQAQSAWDHLRRYVYNIPTCFKAPIERRPRLNMMYGPGAGSWMHLVGECFVSRLQKRISCSEERDGGGGGLAAHGDCALLYGAPSNASAAVQHSAESTKRVRLRRTDTEGYYYDLVDVTRQALANLFVDLILALNYTYNTRSLAQVDR
jgi:hypothetical protein